ncbi:MAG: GNAT family N-acetyltransferase [Anaerolineales bacterium]|nr:GNAT family N-acetyltransferase [Anaerolineales bacterium]MCZ2120985.1 GNAT family N-acetyltransferase [Anaerolineales bacterium]
MISIFETQRASFTISTDPARLEMRAIHEFLARTDWARDRPRQNTETALANSLVFGLYAGDRQIGLARVVTDYSVVAYVCDVFIHEDFRGRGLGKWLIESILSHPNLKAVRRWLLTTEDAHGLYQKYGFAPLDHAEKWMQRLKPFAE